MTFRAKFLTLFSLVVLAGTAVFALGATGLARQQFERFDSERSGALNAQFQLELARRGEEVSYAMQGLADAEATLRMAIDLGRPQVDASVYANDARGLATAHQLDFLDLVGTDGTPITSAEWPARSGNKNDWVTTEQDWNQKGAFLQRVELPGGVELGLLAVRVVSVGARNLYLIGGRRFDRAFLGSLAMPSGTRALLYRNLDAGFVPEDLSDANGPVDQAERFAPLLEATENRQGAAQQTIQWTADPASAEAFVTLPLTGRQNEPLGVVLVGSTQQELVALLNSIRLAALLMAACGLLGGVFLSSWASARVTKPVEKLTIAVRQVTAGNWATKVDVQAGKADEAGQLARAFNQMTGRLTEERARLVQTERVAAWRDVAQGLTQEVKQSLFPLEVTVSSLQRARAESSPRFSETLAESLAALRSELDHLKAAVMRFSEFSKMPQPRLRPMDVNELVRAVLTDFEPRFRVLGRPPITPDLYFAQHLAKIQGDADHLRKALENLLVYSIETMPAGGGLTVRTAQVQGMVQIEIAGGSSGSAAEQGARSFSAFRSGQAPGAGLGLPTTQAIVSDHGGRFFAESVPGVGTTFRLEFAAYSDAIPPPPAAPPDAPKRASRREMPEIPQVEAEAAPAIAALTLPAEPTTMTALATTAALVTTTAPAPEPELPQPLLKND
jgi:two-component system, NtrC family, nitrogen regulation sensor histidine kinase NtrY